MFWSKNLNIFAKDIQNQSVREAFQTKKRENFGPGPDRGGGGGQLEKVQVRVNQ